MNWIRAGKPSIHDYHPSYKEAQLLARALNQAGYHTTVELCYRQCCRILEPIRKLGPKAEQHACRIVEEVLAGCHKLPLTSNQLSKARGL
jgi:hypothetical protein